MRMERIHPFTPCFMEDVSMWKGFSSLMLVFMLGCNLPRATPPRTPLQSDAAPAAAQPSSQSDAVACRSVVQFTIFKIEFNAPQGNIVLGSQAGSCVN